MSPTIFRAGRAAVWLVYRHPAGTEWALGQIDLFTCPITQHMPHAYAESLEGIRAKLPPGACRICGRIIDRLKTWPVIREAWCVEVGEAGLTV